MKRQWFWGIVSAWILLFSCARMGRPEGGPKDTTPPRLIKAVPSNGATGFRGEKIQLYFDEFVQLDNPFTKIIISPPLKIKPEIKPAGYPSKKVEIIFKEPLRENTTYTVYFGDAVKDYTEGNVLKDFAFVFSTGDALDSLKLSGRVIPSLDFEIPGNVVAALYDAGDYRDSLVFGGTPYYLTKVRPDGRFEFKHLAAGEYRIVAFTDENQDYHYQRGKEQIAFSGDTLRLPGKDSITLRLFRESLPPSVQFPKQKTMHLWTAQAEGNLEGLRVVSPGKRVFFYVTGNKQKVINLWIKPVQKADTLNLIFLQNRDTIRNFRLTVKSTDSDTLLFKVNQNARFPSDTVLIATTQPVESMDKNKIEIMPGTAQIIQTVQGTPAIVPPAVFSGDTLKIVFYPGAVTGFTGVQNQDTLQWKIPFLPENKTGSWTGIWEEAPGDAFLIGELTDAEGKKIIRRVLLTSGNRFDFQHLKPGKYRFRILVDLNKNRHWDTGDFLRHKQPEPVYHYPRVIEIRANWHLEEKF